MMILFFSKTLLSKNIVISKIIWFVKTVHKKKIIGIDMTNPVHITQQIKLASSVCKTTPYISQKVKQFADVQILKWIIENVPCLSSTGLLDQIRYSCSIQSE